ncbi:hypothetical protein AURANDRAFT_22507 [Aureococcus anophagefferens]|uniref:Dynein light chain n=1 Tax=Aureococcus anophagefferens TaxID=44056 RepID=F0Y2S8_AURAN|nr:hypothetical protein AURANDRAFT_22507 [Aureococcus anophagefferens]EGB10752.1 hypothetical protein AURANDRAFT_22507 [Aureococcus anophagefferens]|eukprot:XP_009034341.1 hypothetical protein AURANDRAFT_22507 [Aureococcus anophagefferens]
MTSDMQDMAISIAMEALLKNNSETDVAADIKAARFSPARRWHCFVGRNFACYVTYEASSFTYFYIGQVGICLFATD